MLQIVSLGIGIGFGLHLMLSLIGYSIYSLFNIANIQ